jgi:hypothetical protein
MPDARDRQTLETSKACRCTRQDARPSYAASHQSLTPGQPLAVQKLGAVLHMLRCAAQVGIALVGASSLLSGEGSSTRKVSQLEMLAGMGLIVLSQVGHRGRTDRWSD